MLEQTMSAIVLSPLPIAGGEGAPQAGAGRRKVTAKALKRALKKAGLKTTGKKAALTRRAKKAHLKVGGADEPISLADTPLAPKDDDLMGGRRRRSRKNGLVQGVYRGTTGIAKGTLRSVGRLGRSVFGRGGNGKMGGNEL
jgi:hypothetical protein